MDFTLSGPYTHDNLQIFLVHGADRIKGKTWLTLAEAMAAKKVIVHETGSVNELSIENVGTDDVFVEAGEIVKGGRQDRLLSVDMILPPKSGKVPITSYCVESGRWSGRGHENAAAFGGSTEKIASKEMKLAARKDNDQGKVWEVVAASQAALGEKVGADVKAGASPSSYQLTLENDKVQKARADYVKALESAPDGKDDVIGYAFAVNGQVNSADVYASHALFAKLWKKQLDAAATEALTDKDGKSFAPATATAVQAVFAEAQAGKAAPPKPIGTRSTLKTKESDKAILFDTEDVDGNPVKQSYITR